MNISVLQFFPCIDKVHLDFFWSPVQYTTECTHCPGLNSFQGLELVPRTKLFLLEAK